MSRDAVIGKLLWEVSPTAVGSEFERRYRKVMAKREKQVFETFTTRIPGRWHEVRAFPLGDEIGVSFRDATERLSMFERLSQRELELARVQEIGDIGGMRVELSEGFPSQRSPEYLRIHGLPAEAALESHDDWVKRIHPEDRDRAVSHLFATLEGQSTAYASEYRIVRSERRRRAMDSGGRGDRARREGRGGRARRRTYRHHRKEAGRGGGAGERRAAAGHRRRPARPDLLHRPRPGLPLRQPDLRDLVRATASRDRRARRRRGHDARDVCGPAGEPRAGAQGRGGLLRGRVSADRGAWRSPRSSTSPIATRAGRCSAFTWW